MNNEHNQRRHFLKAGLATALLLGLPISKVHAATGSKKYLDMPQNLRDELYKIYGRRARRILLTDQLKLDMPEIAENGAVVPATISGEQGTASSLVILVERNPQPVATRISLYEGADFRCGTRLKIGRSSNVYLVVKTDQGLIGSMTNVKVTIGCGGG